VLLGASGFYSSLISSSSESCFLATLACFFGGSLSLSSSEDESFFALAGWALAAVFLGFSSDESSSEESDSFFAGFLAATAGLAGCCLACVFFGASSELSSSSDEESFLAGALTGTFVCLEPYVFAGVATLACTFAFGFSSDESSSLLDSSTFGFFVSPFF